MTRLNQAWQAIIRGFECGAAISGFFLLISHAHEAAAANFLMAAYLRYVQQSQPKIAKGKRK